MPKTRPEKSLSLVFVDGYSHPVIARGGYGLLRFVGPRKSPLAEVEKLLRKHCPVSLPVSVKYCDLSEAKLCGRCLVFADKTGKLKRFEIEIDPKLPEPVVVDSFIHEWAHAMDYDRNGLSKKRHRKSWGVCFAEAWSCYDEASDV